MGILVKHDARPLAEAIDVAWPSAVIEGRDCSHEATYLTATFATVLPRTKRVCRNGELKFHAALLLTAHWDLLYEWTGVQSSLRTGAETLDVDTNANIAAKVV